MSGITLSASVRQNLLSLQSTSDLLSQTQERLATGNKVNSALDNPTNYFTASSLNNRASDISNLLDGIGNGVQVLQAANTGITSLQSLVDTAKSIANQALQATSGYSAKSQFSSAAITGASASNLLGSVTPASNAVVTGTAALGTLDLTGTPINAVAQGSVALSASTTAASSASTTAASVYTGNEFASGDSIVVGGTTVAFDGTTDGTTAIAGSSYTGTEAADKINHDLQASSTTSDHSITATYDSVHDKIVLSNSATGAASNFTVDASGSAGNDGGFGGTAVTTTNGANASGGIDASAGAKSFTITLDGGTATTVTLATNGGTNHDGHYSANDLKTAINGALTTAGVTTLAATVDTNNKLVLTSTSATKGSGDTIGVADVASSGLTAALGFSASTTGTTTAAADESFDVNGHAVTLAHGSSYTASQIKDAINTQVGTSAKVHATLDTNGKLVLTSTATAGASDAVTVDTFSGSSDASTLGLAASGTTTVTDNGADASGGLQGQTLTIGATAGGTALNITFGTGTASINSSTGVSTNINTLADLNTALSADNLEASLSSDGKLTVSTVNDNASSTIGAIGGTSVSTTGAPFASSTVTGPAVDADAQSLRSNLISQYNNVITQIQTTAQDSSFNGVNLLNGDQLKLVFNETGKSTLNIQGVTDDPTGLGLSTLTGGTDFLDNASTNKVLSSLNDASNTLRSQASTLGSNLSIVQIRQDFSKNLINVLQTGASNLTLADTNEEAANSQALSTRQSIAVSALALANQSQQSVLRLLQ